MSSNNVAHVSSVDKGLKMKIKRTKGPNKVDSKHEVVKSDSPSKTPAASSGQPVSTLASPASLSTSSSQSSLLSSSSAATSLAVVSSTLASGTSVNSSTSHVMATSSSTSSSLSSSSSVPSSLTSLTSATVSSHCSKVVPNPTVALLKAANAGIASDDYSTSNLISKSPLKTSVVGGATGTDMKDGKSPKTKAAYNKKVKDKTKSETSSMGSASGGNSNGINAASGDTRTSLGVASGVQTFTSATSTFSTNSGVVNSGMTSEPRPGDTVHVKRENPVHDPYEFNAKVEDKIELPPKKLKLEKVDCIETAISPQSQQQQQQHLHQQQHASPPSMMHSQLLPPPPPQMMHHQQQQQQQQHPHPHQPPLPPLHQQQQQQHKRSVGVDACSVGVVTEPECLGPCEPGTLVGLEGIVWKETDNGLLVVNVTWRGKTYVGTLMDATRYAWAPPRPSGCESPVSDFESRTPKGRGKRNSRNSVQSNESRLPEGRRLRKGRRGTVNSSSSNFTAPPSPAKSDISSVNVKRKARPNELELDKPKRSRSCSRGVNGSESPTTDGYIVCPEPNCHKKYKHMNGLRYHRTHAHRKSSVTDDGKDEEDEDEEDEKSDSKKEKTTLSERAERMKAKERQRLKEQQRGSDRDSKDSLDDDIPLKEIANKAQKSDNVNKDRSEEESGSNSTDGSSSFNSSSGMTSKIDPQVVLTKTTIHLQNSVSPSTISVIAKKKDSNAVDASSTAISSAASLVPSVTPDKETSLPLSVYSNSSNNSMSVMTTLKSSITSQVYQISPSVCLGGGTSLISPASTSLNMITAQTLPLMTSTAGLPPSSTLNSTTTPTSVLGMSLSADRQNSGKGPSGFMKAVTTARPIVPAPSPQMVGLGSSHPQNPSSTQVHGSALKPIQPKPTIMGDYPSVSPALADLNRDKARKQKKKKEKDSSATSPAGIAGPGSKGLLSSGAPGHSMSEAVPQDVERAAVIKSANPSKAYDTSSPGNEMSNSTNSPFQSSVDSQSLQNAISSESPMLSGSRLVMPPSSLPLPSSTEQRSTINDDVHSPAYSDISDANDSNSPPQQDSPKKDTVMKKDGQLNGPPHLGPDGASLSQHFGNMYYFGGPRNYLPHGINPQLASPTLPKGMMKKDGPDDGRPSSSNDDGSEKKDGARSMQESELLQKSLYNYYPPIHGVNPAVQYPYNLPGYNPAAMDSSYVQNLMLAQQDPAFRQHLAEQQKRLLQQQQADMANKAEDNSGKRTPSGIPSGNRPMGPGFESSGRPTMSPSMVAGLSESSMDQKRINDERDQALRDKQSENHQILKENIELKSQMGLHHDHQQQNYHLLKQQQQHQQNRVQMYQQQQQQQKQKVFDNQRQQQDKRKGPSDLASSGPYSSAPSSAGPGSRLQSDTKPGDLLSHDMIKKEPTHSKDSSKSDSRLGSIDTKLSDIKDENGSSSRPSSSLDMSSNRSRPPSQSSTPNIPAGTSSSSSTSSSLPSSMASLLPVSVVTSLPPTSILGAGYAHPSYYPPFRPMQLDPGHPMYRALNPHIIGYASAPPGAYIHPPQLGYRMPSGESDRKSPTPVDSLKGSSSSDNLGVPASTGYTTPVHKIHELQEKGRPSPGVHSPAPPKTGGGDPQPSSGSTTPGPPPEKTKDKQREYSSSPPTQRHVHTHHHTHVVGGFPPLYPPDAYTMFSHPAAAAAAAASIQPSPHPFPQPQPPPQAPKS